MYFDDGDLEFIEEASKKRYWVFGRVRTGFTSDVRLIIIWIVRLETFWRPSNIKVSFSSSFIPFSSSEPDYSLISRKDFSKKSDQKPIKYRLIKMIKENQATIIQIIPVIIFEKNSIILDTVWTAGLEAADFTFHSLICKITRVQKWPHQFHTEIRQNKSRTKWRDFTKMPDFATNLEGYFCTGPLYSFLGK